MTFRPFCHQCGSIRPDGRDDVVCVPCLNTGHMNTIVLDEDDAKRRILVWLEYYTKHGFTSRQVQGIPSWKRLLQSVCDEKLASCLLGAPRVVTEGELDSWDWVADYVRTCRNRRQCGGLDQYVAWFFDAPKDLAFMEGYAVGSGLYTSEVST